MKAPEFVGSWELYMVISCSKCFFEIKKQMNMEQPEESLFELQEDFEKNPHNGCPRCKDENRPIVSMAKKFICPDCHKTNFIFMEPYTSEIEEDEDEEECVMNHYVNTDAYCCECETAFSTIIIIDKRKMFRKLIRK